MRRSRQPGACPAPSSMPPMSSRPHPAPRRANSERFRVAPGASDVRSAVRYQLSMVRYRCRVAREASMIARDDPRAWLVRPFGPAEFAFGAPGRRPSLRPSHGRFPSNHAAILTRDSLPATGYVETARIMAIEELGVNNSNNSTGLPGFPGRMGVRFARALSAGFGQHAEVLSAPFLSWVVGFDAPHRTPPRASCSPRKPHASTPS